MNQLILASQSPRRKEILSSLGYRFDVIPADIDENIDLELGLDEALKKLALSKAQAVHDKHPDSVVLAADTIVCLDGKILGKPADRKQAKEMLCSLSGRAHQVKTALAFLFKDQQISLVVTSEVIFDELEDDRIEEYLDRKTYLDKAGSYGIQETDFVREIHGSYSNVVGLPMRVVDFILNDIQIDPDISF